MGSFLPISDYLERLLHSEIRTFLLNVPPPNMDNLRIIIAEDHLIFIEGLKTILRLDEGYSYELVGEANTGAELVQLLKEHTADLLFLDLNMPDGDGLELLPEIKALQPEMAVLVLTMFDDPKIVKSAFKAGVDGYLLKGNRIEEIFEAVHELMEGKTFMGEGVMLNVLPGEAGMDRRRKRSPFREKFLQKYNLTAREMEVLQLITQALSNKEIAKALFISDQTVSVHRKNIMRKLGVSNTAALLKVAYENDLV